MIIKILSDKNQHFIPTYYTYATTMEQVRDIRSLLLIIRLLSDFIRKTDSLELFFLHINST